MRSACGIYALINIQNGKMYVGSAKCTKDRTNRHLRWLKDGVHWNLHLQAAWNQGQRFRVKLLEECCEDVLIVREQFYMDLHKTLDKRFGYNLTIAGRTIPSEEGRKRIGDVRRGKTLLEILGPERAKTRLEGLRKQMGGSGNPMYGMRGDLHPFHGKTTTELFGEDVAKKMALASSKAHKGKKLSKETKDKISAARSGVALSKEHKSAIAQGMAANYESVGPRTMEEKYGEERATELKAKIAQSVSKSTKGVPKKPLRECKLCGEPKIPRSTERKYCEECKPKAMKLMAESMKGNQRGSRK